jgi:hypothetical protein
MESIQDQSTALNVWHIKDDQTIGINWVKGNIHQWTEPVYLMRKQHILWRDHKLEIDGAVERIEYGATVTLWIKHDGKRYFHCFTKYKWLGGTHGDSLPVIKTGSHRLYIRPYITGVTLSDMPLYEQAIGTTDSFYILNRVEN